MKIEITTRHLPHWFMEGAVYFITFRTITSKLSVEEQTLILKHITDGDRKYYNLVAIVVMPDHVHLILQPLSKYNLSRIMKGIKGVTAILINKNRKSKGSIWQAESFDRIIRNQEELSEKLNYMINNPVKKGLGDDPMNYHGWYINIDSEIF